MDIFQKIVKIKKFINLIIIIKNKKIANQIQKYLVIILIKEDGKKILQIDKITLIKINLKTKKNIQKDLQNENIIKKN